MQDLVILVPAVLMCIAGWDLKDALMRKWGVRFIAISLVIVAAKMFFSAGE